MMSEERKWVVQAFRGRYIPKDLAVDLMAASIQGDEVLVRRQLRWLPEDDYRAQGLAKGLESPRNRNRIVAVSLGRMSGPGDLGKHAEDLILVDKDRLVDPSKWFRVALIQAFLLGVRRPCLAIDMTVTADDDETRQTRLSELCERLANELVDAFQVADQLFRNCFDQNSWPFKVVVTAFQVEAVSTAGQKPFASFWKLLKTRGITCLSEQGGELDL